MSQRLNNLNELISVLSAGANFYRKAARQTGRTDAEAVYLSHAELRDRVAHDLAGLVDRAGHEPARPAPGEQARSVLTQVGTLFDDTELTLAKGLEGHEDRTLSTFNKVMNHPDNAQDETRLREYYADFEKSHAQMRELRAAT